MTTVSGINPNWRCNALPPSMRRSTMQRISDAFHQCAYADVIPENASKVEKLATNLCNSFKLIDEAGLSGYEKIVAQFHNMMLAGSCLNPAATTTWYTNIGQNAGKAIRSLFH